VSCSLPSTSFAIFKVINHAWQEYSGLGPHHFGSDGSFIRQKRMTLRVSAAAAAALYSLHQHHQLLLSGPPSTASLYVAFRKFICLSVCLSVSRLPVINGRIKYKLLSHRQGQPTSCLFSPSQYPLFVVTRGRPPTYSSLKITDRSFRYHPPHLWTYLSSWFISSASSSLCTLFSAFLFFILTTLIIHCSFVFQSPFCIILLQLCIYSLRTASIHEQFCFLGSPSLCIWA